MSTELTPFNPEKDELEGAAVEGRAVRGASLLVGRSMIVLSLTAFATIALARLLSPADYGAFAVAVAIQALGRQAVELGIPLALVRRPEPPSSRELRALTGFMLAAGAALGGVAVLVCFVALPLLGLDTEVTRVTGIACCALPLFGLRAVPALLLERRLGFGRLAIIEVSETAAFYGFALPAAIAGLGAASLAGAVPVSAAAGVIAATLVQPWRRVASLDLDALRPIMAFAAKTAALTPIYFARELGIVSALSLAGGSALAGFYAMSQRLFAVPTAMMHAIWRVGVAGLARGTPGDERNRQALAALATTVVAVGLPLAVIVGAAEPLIELLFGSRWLPAADVVLFAAPGVLLISSTAATLTGLALADGDARSPLIAEISGGLLAVALAGALGGPLGSAGAGIAAGVGLSAIPVLLLWRSRLERSLVVGAAGRALVAVGAGVAAGRLVPGESVPALLAALAASGGAWLILSTLIMRGELRMLIALLRRHLPVLRERRPLPSATNPAP